MAAVLALGGTAYGDGSPVAGVAVGGPGVTWGSLRYVALATHGGTAVAQIDRATGEVNAYAALRGGWGIPQVAFDGTTAGISAGGRTLVLGQLGSPYTQTRSRFALVNPVKMRLERIVTLHGAFFFDAISPDGGSMYLIQLSSPQNGLRYSVRAYDLRHDRLLPGAVVDKTEPDERMVGFPMSRAESSDGVWSYTLYEKPTGRYFVHALDTSAGTARCIDLPRLASQSLRLAIDGARLDVVAGSRALAAVSRATYDVTVSPAPIAHSVTSPAKPQAPARRSSSGAPVWVAVRSSSWPASRCSPSDGGGQRRAGDQAGLRRGHHLALEHRPEGGTRFRQAQCAQVRLAKIAVVARDAARLGSHSQIPPGRTVPGAPESTYPGHSNLPLSRLNSR